MRIRWRLTVFNALTIGTILLGLGLALFFLLRGALLSGAEETVQSRAVVAARDVRSGAVSILLDNAVKYTPEGGRVTVAARQRDNRAEVAVSDTGIGIPGDQLPLIFERFHRVDEARVGGGAGLGLAIARQISSAHGGEIEVKSVPGEGSTFVLWLPRQNPRL